PPGPSPLLQPAGTRFAAPVTCGPARRPPRPTQVRHAVNLAASAPTRLKSRLTKVAWGASRPRCAQKKGGRPFKAPTFLPGGVGFTPTPDQGLISPTSPGSSPSGAASAAGRSDPSPSC